MPRRSRRTHSFTDDQRGPRLQRVLADAGIASRRRCEELILEGAVSVNGEIIDALPAWVDPSQDRILVSGRLLPRRGSNLYVMLYKPKGFVSTNDDPEGRPRAIDLVRHPSGARLYPVGRLDIDSSGLLLLTNDGELTNRLTHPRYEMHKVYEVTVGGTVPDGDLQHLESVVDQPGPRAASGPETERSSLQIIKRDRTRTMLRMQLTEGRNRQIRLVLQRLGHPVKKLRRVQMGPLRLRGLAIGEWRELTAAELGELRREAFRSPAERRKSAARKGAAPHEGSRSHGTSRASGSPRSHGTSSASGSPRSHGTSRASGSPRSHGTLRASGSPRSHGTSRASGSPRSHGTERSGAPGRQRWTPQARGDARRSAPSATRRASRGPR